MKVLGLFFIFNLCASCASGKTGKSFVDALFKRDPQEPETIALEENQAPTGKRLVSYRVKQHDSLAKISYQLYGDPRHWRLLAKINQEKLDDAYTLNVGGRVLTPVSFKEPHKEPRLEGYGLYKVKKGETLTEISQKLYGSTRFWPVLLRANRNLLRRPNVLYSGFVIKYPPLKEAKAELEALEREEPRFKFKLN